MNDSLRFHRRWLILLAAALLLFVLTPPLAGRMNADRTARVIQLQKQKDALFARIRQTESDAIAADELSQTIEAKEVEKFLAPASRRAIAAHLERLALQAQLAHMRYSFAPATPLTGPDIPDGIVQSALTVEADAPTDAEIFRFIESLSDLAGRVDIQSVSMVLLGGETGALNLHTKIEMLWLGNAGGTP